jgi:hypothetical protein
VAELAQQGQRGQLPGAFYGRLCNVARAQQGAERAVNAVLMEACSLVGCNPPIGAVLQWLFCKGA